MGLGIRPAHDASHARCGVSFVPRAAVTPGPPDCGPPQPLGYPPSKVRPAGGHHLRLKLGPNREMCLVSAPRTGGCVRFRTAAPGSLSSRTRATTADRGDRAMDARCSPYVAPLGVTHPAPRGGCEYGARSGILRGVGPPDHWADWLIRGRQRGLDERQIRALTKALRRMRNRVLAGARLRRDVSVLDVGAGTGLLAVEARSRVGGSACIIALDISTDALAESARTGIALGLIAGDAVALPLPDQCVDVVVMRSVLIYVADKARAASEFHRVLRPGGRVSLFEPINSQYKSLADVDLSDLEPARSRVLERWHRGGDPRGAMGGFDDRDLVGYFVDAGFETVELTHEIVHRRTRARAPEVGASLTIRPNPNMVSYEEAAREVLGSAADEHLSALASALTKRLSTSVDAGAYIRARRATR